MKNDVSKMYDNKNELDTPKMKIQNARLLLKMNANVCICESCGLYCTLFDSDADAQANVCIVLVL